MKLISLKIHANGNGGLESDLLSFGPNITQLYGPNGCGKTPTVQSIAFCLGYPCVFREEIYRRCSKAVLVFSVANARYEVSRVFSKDSDISVRGPVGQNWRFHSEGEYSEFLFDLLGIRYPNFVSTQEKLSKPYLATILPLFYLDQDDGYKDFYSPHARFIKDQFSEMVRLLFDLPVKNSFDQKKDKIDAKAEVNRLDELVLTRQQDLERAKRNLPDIEDLEELNARTKSLERDLDSLKLSGNQHSDSVAVVDRLIGQTSERIRDIDADLREIDKRGRSVNRIIEEINTEINALSLNEESRRVFLSFDEICESAECQLFSVSSAAYAKNLLYLKDQIKDLERNAKSDTFRVESLRAARGVLVEQSEQMLRERNAMIESSEMSAVIDAISRIKEEIFLLQTKRAEVEKLNALQSRYFSAMVERNKALDQYEALSNDRSSNPELIRLRADFRLVFLRWLDVIGTDNINRNISFKDDLNPIFGIETIVQLKGSTKVRAVLAFHAAILELALARSRTLFNFLILDTPKQHDINNADLGAYVKELKTMSVKYGFQIIFSNTEFHYDGDENDVEWLPVYPGEKHKMFYRVVS